MWTYIVLCVGAKTVYQKCFMALGPETSNMNICSGIWFSISNKMTKGLPHQWLQLRFHLNISMELLHACSEEIGRIIMTHVYEA